ncbi:uncharacterized protein MONBRDRAFT_28618 [Monosiga brevicollis MX1]|uniref:Nudix hydrolase domain-containing protein n=1 Tax=Monosiga brevicollis TaxID=81824 RepID=A9V8P6_MONBE|nr:uncharacterized protein MONBRDRAFT_28618 [Monosiga brevicollis MX1]EDQ86122.1 predicted protein [Monosiga brevicollis MX1]|eukprot:XP_001749047.1 hypothetical protein [Monosiga brevicollis MX1]
MPVDFPEYAPVEYTAPVVANKPVWADDEDKIAEFKFNALDGDTNRVSFDGTYEIEKDTSRPINLHGRTGMRGRGLLGKFGPNHAADPVVSRWQRLANGEVARDEEGQPVLEIVFIKRKDTGEWALPGGMVEAGDTVSVTLKKEFGEEALNSLEADEVARETLKAVVDRIFQNGDEIYRGYVDDPRNTDNAWMETVAVNFHDKTGSAFGHFNLTAGDDAGSVAWVKVTPDMALYASHADFVREVYSRRSADYGSA